MDDPRLSDKFAHCHSRIQRRIRILEYDLHSFSDLAQRTLPKP